MQRCCAFCMVNICCNLHAHNMMEISATIVHVRLHGPILLPYTSCRNSKTATIPVAIDALMRDCAVVTLGRVLSPTTRLGSLRFANAVLSAAERAWRP